MSVLRSLDHLAGIGEDDIRRLHGRGIRNTNQLLHATSLELDRKRVSERTGISEPRLLELGKQAALWEVSGANLWMDVLRRLGITSQKDLKRQDAAELHGRLLDAIGFGGAPSLSDVEYWISQARLIDVLEDPADPAAADLVPGRHRTTAEAMRIVG